MKKIISLLCALTVSSTAPISVIYCAKENKEIENSKDKQYIDEMEENLISNQLEKDGIDGSNLSVNNTLQDALNLIYEKISMNDEVESVILKEGKLTDILVEGKNEIKIEYQAHEQKKN